MNENAQFHVVAACKEIAETGGIPKNRGTIAEALMAMLWPYIVETAKLFGAPPEATVPGAEDRRSKPWQYVVRFWEGSGDDAKLVAETDPAIMVSTGHLPKIIMDLMIECHDQYPLDSGELKEKLPQFRNNLGRSRSATLRIPYVVDGVGHVCQVDVFRLDA